MGSNFPVRNESMNEMIYKMNHILKYMKSSKAMRRSNQLSYEATDVGSCSFVGSNFPVRNESMNEMIYEMNQILNCGYEIK